MSGEKVTKEIEQMAKDVCLAIRNGVNIEEEMWDGPRQEDQEMTSDLRRIAAYLYSMGYRKVAPN